MNTAQIKEAINDGHRVFWHHYGYEVIKDSIGQYLIKCHMNNYCIGLTWRDGQTLNGDEKEFFISKSKVND